MLAFHLKIVQKLHFKLLIPIVTLLFAVAISFNSQAQQRLSDEHCTMSLEGHAEATQKLAKDERYYSPLPKGENRLRLSCNLNEQAIFTFGKDEIIDVTLETNNVTVKRMLANSPSYLLPAGNFHIDFIFVTHHDFLQQFSWLSTATFLNSNLLNNITMGAFYGLSLTLIFYVFFMGRMLGDNRFQFYSLYVFCSATFFLLQEGQLNIVLPQHSFLLSHQFYLLFAGLTVLTAVIFIVRLTDINKEWPRLTRYLLEPAAVLVFMMSIMMLLLDHNLLSGYIGQAMSRITLLIMICIFMLVAIQAFANKKMAKWVLFSLGIMVVAMFFRTIFQDLSPFLHRYALIFAFSIEAFILAVVVLTRVKNIEQDKIRAESLASTDELCNVLNRRGWEKQAQQILELQSGQGGVTCLIYLDLNDFKKINDNFGHDAGDKVLKLVAAEIDSQLNVNQHLGRIGGDEFVIIGHFEDDISAQKFASIMQKRLGVFHLKIAEQQVLDVAVSVGYRIFEEAPNNIRDMVILADESMYKIKHAKNNNNQSNNPHLQPN